MSRFCAFLATAAAVALALPTAAEPRALLDQLERQIAEINANIASLGCRNAGAQRFLAASLAAYQRTWAELTRSEVDFGATAGQDPVAALSESRP
jgi:hypothetical protein